MSRARLRCVSSGFILGGAFALLGWCLPVRAASGSDGVAAYSQSVRAAAQSLEAAARAGARSVPAVHVPPAPLPGPPRYSPSLDDWLQAVLVQARLQKPKPRTRTLLQAASSLRYALVSVRQPAVEPTRGIAPTLASILANPAYHQAESNVQAKTEKTWWERFIEWLEGMFERLFRGLSSAAAGVPLLGRTVLVIGIVGSAALILLMGYRLARYFVSRRRRARTHDVGEVIETLEPPETLYARAREAAAAGRFAAAVALLFRAGLQQLDVAGVIPYDAARTAGEYRRAVHRSHAPAAAPFDDLARSFTMAAYAEAPVDERDWHGADEAYNAFTPHLDAARATKAAARS